MTYDKESGKFETVLLYNEDTEISGGMYDNAEEAAKAYDALARMYFGPGAEVNYPVSILLSAQMSLLQILFSRFTVFTTTV